MKRLLVILSALLLVLGVATTASAAIVEAIGDPELGNSWAQSFRVTNYGSSFDRVAVVWTTDPLYPGQFELPVFQRIGVSGWTNDPGSSPQIASVSGPAVDQLRFSVWFDVQDPSVPVKFDLYHYLGVNTAPLGVYTATWNRIRWSIVPESGGMAPSWNELMRQGAVPEPASVLVWSGVGLAGAGLALRRRRRQARRWSEGSRSAICQMIESGRRS